MSDGEASREESQINLAEVVRKLVTLSGDPARTLELFYWAQEPGILECVRGLLAMPPEARGALLTFLAAAEKPANVSATIDKTGAMILFSPDAAKIMRTFFGRARSRLAAPRFHS
jgi:hypothetical protein